MKKIDKYVYLDTDNASLTALWGLAFSFDGYWENIEILQ